MNEIKRGIVEELHRAARKRFPRRRFQLRAWMEYLQSDLADLSKFSDENEGNHFLLVVIDCFSKYAWVEPLKDKTGLECAKKFEKILKKFKKIPKLLQVDGGTEYWNKHFTSLTKRYKIHMYTTYSPIKAGIAERFIKNLKERLWKHFSLNGTYNYTKNLQNIVTSYNNSIHSSINLKPSEVSERNENIVLSYINRKGLKKVKGVKFMKGDAVRISKYKHIFEKGYTPSWSTEIFFIVEKKQTNPPTYLLVDYNGEKILGAFYAFELQKTKYKNDYLVEKVIKERKNKQYVKWLGFTNEHNSWIDK